MAFPKYYTGTLSHPDIDYGKDIKMTVIRKSHTTGTFCAGTVKDTENIEFVEHHVIGFSTFRCDFFGIEEVASGCIKGVVTISGVRGVKGGTFMLMPDKEDSTIEGGELKSKLEDGSSAGSPVKAVRALRGKAAEPGNEYRALSVWFIVNKLMDDLGAKDDSKVYDVEPCVREKGANAVCPRDGKNGAAYVDVAEDPHAGYATHMLSYTWGYTLKDIKDTLQGFCMDNNLDMKQVRVWMCFACINQHRVKEAQANKETVPFEAFKKVFGDRVENIGHILPMMSPWNMPYYITRVWCCFEIFTAIDLGDKCKVTVLLPPKQSTEFSEAFDKGAEKTIFNALRAIDVHKANASVPEDKEQILKLIKEGPGLHKVNTAIVKHLREWFMTQATRNEADRLCKLGRVCSTFGASQAGFSLLEQSRAILRSINEHTSPLGVKVAICSTEAEYIRTSEGDKRRYEIALKEYMQAEEFLEQNGTDSTLDAAELATKMCLVAGTAHERGRMDKDEAAGIMLKQGERGLKLFEELDKVNSCEGMHHLFVYASALGEDVAFKKAEAMFEKAVAIGKELNLTGDENYIKGIEKYGMLYYKCGKVDDAVEYVAEAKRGYEALGMTDTPQYLECCFMAGAAYWKGELKKDLKLAVSCFTAARDAVDSKGGASQHDMSVRDSVAEVLEQLREEMEEEARSSRPDPSAAGGRP